MSFRKLGWGVGGLRYPYSLLTFPPTIYKGCQVVSSGILAQSLTLIRGKGQGYFRVSDLFHLGLDPDVRIRFIKIGSGSCFKSSSRTETKIGKLEIIILNLRICDFSRFLVAFLLPGSVSGTGRQKKFWIRKPLLVLSIQISFPNKWQVKSILKNSKYWTFSKKKRMQDFWKMTKYLYCLLAFWSINFEYFWKWISQVTSYLPDISHESTILYMLPPEWTFQPYPIRLGGTLRRDWASQLGADLFSKLSITYIGKTWFKDIF